MGDARGGYAHIETFHIPGWKIDVYVSPLGTNCGVLRRIEDLPGQESQYKLDENALAEAPVHSGTSSIEVHRGGYLLRLDGHRPVMYATKDMRGGNPIKSYPVFEEKEFKGAASDLISKIDRYYVAKRQAEYELAMKDTHKINGVVQAISEKDALIRAKHLAIKGISSNISRLREDTILRVDEKDSDADENRKQLVGLNADLDNAMREYAQLCSDTLQRINALISEDVPEKVVGRRPRRTATGQ